MIDHQTYFSQLLMPVFSHWDSEPRSQFFLAYMARSSNTVPFGPGGFFPLPMGISMDLSMDLHRWTWDFSIGHPPSSLMVYPLDVHWMVYHPLEDGLRKIGWFTVIIDEPLNWMVYSTFLSLVPPSAWRRCGAFRGSKPLFEQSLEVGSNKNIKKHIGSTTRN